MFLRTMTKELMRTREILREDEDEDYLNIDKIVEKCCFEKAKNMDRDNKVNDKV
jgi:hypothetical protein